MKMGKQDELEENEWRCCKVYYTILGRTAALLWNG